MLRGGNKQALRGTTRRPDRPSHALLHHSGAPPARRKTLLFSLHLFSQSGSLERWLISTECSRVCDCSLLTGRRPIICLSCAHTSFLLFFFPFSFLTPPFVLQGSVLCPLKWIDNRGCWRLKSSVFSSTEKDALLWPLESRGKWEKLSLLLSSPPERTAFTSTNQEVTALFDVTNNSKPHLSSSSFLLCDFPSVKSSAEGYKACGLASIHILYPTFLIDFTLISWSPSSVPYIESFFSFLLFFFPRVLFLSFSYFLSLTEPR